MVGVISSNYLSTTCTGSAFSGQVDSSLVSDLFTGIFRVFREKENRAAVSDRRVVGCR